MERKQVSSMPGRQGPVPTLGNVLRRLVTRMAKAPSVAGLERVRAHHNTIPVSLPKQARLEAALW